MITAAFIETNGVSSTDADQDTTDQESGADPTDSPEPVVNLDELSPLVEAILVTSEKAVGPARIADILDIDLDQGGGKSVLQAIEHLNTIYADSGRTFRIEKVAGGYRLMTLPEFADTVRKQRQSSQSTKLSQAALETLAIVAYRQSLTRAEVERIRGVACGEVLRSLLERHLIKITGRADEVGRPMLYGTTRHFLEIFGLATLKDLPDSKELREP